MGKKFPFVLLVCLTIASFASPQIGRSQQLEYSIFKHPAPGYYLVALNSAGAFSLIDHSGTAVFADTSRSPVNLMCYDSTLTYYDGFLQAFIRLNVHFQPIDTFAVGGYPTDYHEGRVLPNGNYITLGIDDRIMDLSAVVPGGKSAAHVIGAVIQERTVGGAIVFQWKSLDHIPVTDATEAIDLTQAAIDYIHVNSVFLDNDNNYLVSCRHTDEIIKINRTDGSVMWRMGGQKSKGNQFTFINDTEDGFTGFSHQHDASRTMAGNILLFDNGNLKANQPSRVVEYQVDEQAKTATRTWSYSPGPNFFTSSMGSAEELSNGNILIGFGAAAATQPGKTPIGQEVSRDGTVQAELVTTDPGMTYRLRKAVFAMSGKELRVTSPGEYSFSNGDSTTHFSTMLSRVSASTSIIAERHSYTPHNLSFENGSPCVPMQMRWVVRVSDMSNIAGLMRFAIGSFGITVPTLLQVYHRPKEGEGTFVQLNASYDLSTESLALSEFRSGEYLIGYPMCYNPTPTLPLTNATNVPMDATFRWSEAVQTGGYDVEVFRGSAAVGTPLMIWHTTALDTTVTMPEAGALFTWRVRARRPNAEPIGPWSPTYSFRTSITAPTALFPSSLPDSIAVHPGTVFKWTKVIGAAWYRIRVVPLGSSSPVLDTLVLDTSFVLGGSLPCNMSMNWSVRGEVGTNFSGWSENLFVVTPPCAPRLLLPVAGAVGIEVEEASCSWSAVNGAKLYHIRVYKDSTQSAIWFQDSTTSNGISLFDLVSKSVYHWQVRTISRYGAGPWSSTQWFMTRGQSVLGISSLLTPVDVNGVDTLDASLAWSSVLEATMYHVELTTKSSFVKPDFEWSSVPSTSLPVPPLDAGKVYRWRVMALNDIANGPWSAVGSFTTMPGPDDALEPLTPVAGCLDVPLRGNVTFISDARFNEYHVEYALDPLFTAVEQTSTVTSGVAPYNLEAERQYWWHVIGLSNGVAIDTGSTTNFITGKVDATSVFDGPQDAPLNGRLNGNTLTLELPGVAGYMSEGSAFRIVDITGRSIYELSPHQSSTFPISVDLSSMPTGVYVAVLRLSDARVISHRFFFHKARP